MTTPLVTNWFSWLKAEKITISQGLRDLNEALGEKYRTNAAYQWRNGTYLPCKRVLDYMRSCVSRRVIEGETLKLVPQHVADAIAKELS